MTDFHAHLLPAIDDGSDSVETSLAMLDIWRAQGIGRVCATPHFYAERTTPERFLSRRAAALQALKAAGGGGPKGPEIRCGAEVRFFDGVGAAEALPALCLEGSDLLLLEMPFTRWTDRMLGEVAEIRQRGLRPVAAHLERYLDLNPGQTIRRFLDMDVLIQCNAEFFLSRRTARRALRMLREERIHFLGSDAHNVSSRAPDLGPALDLIERKLGPAAIDRLLALERLAEAR
jgi:protein-tyrosine phosphatase